MDYRINIIIPVYNGEEYITQTIKSILKAGKGEVLIILVDDGSTDQSGIICKKYQEQFDNILYFRKENGGIVSARNKGLELAFGDYICFCDQDDIIEDDFFDVMLKNIEEKECDVVICGTNRYVNGEKIVCEQFQDGLWVADDIMQKIIYPVLFYGTDLGRPSKERWVGSIWKCIIKRALIEQYHLKFRKYVNYEDDLLFFIDVLTHAHKVGMLSYIGYNWRINSKSETYNWKYIENYCDKYMQFTNDMINMITKICDDQRVIQNYRLYQLCTMYEGFILNEGSIHNKKNLLKKIQVIKKVIKQNEYEKAISFRNHISKSSFRKRAALSLISHKQWFLAYFWLVSYKKLREKIIKHKIWFILEQKIKARSKD